MNPSLDRARWQRIEEVFQSALDLPSAERARYLEHTCDDEPSLRAEVERLLIAHDQAGSLLEAPAAARMSDLPLADAEAEEGDVIGPYRVIRHIGRGGMGAVCLAVRADGQYEKHVAIKTVRRGLDLHGGLVERFRQERQILAHLEHAHICKLLDGGTTADGRPYLAMEYVAGRPLIEYATRSGLTVDQRLEIFLKICSAVHYGHQRLIVHRDIKPNNILVTDDGQPKLLDFGIAKLLDPDAQPRSTETVVTLLRAMTPEYASPEQIRGEPITTASDIYSLGVLLYELLAERRPHRVSGRLPHEVARIICEEEPEAPSSAVGRTGNGAAATPFVTPARRAQSSRARQLRRRLRGDLDNIVLTAMRKEPERRYASVQQLAEDVRRHLNGLPVTARKDTLVYRSGKFVRRHKAGVAVAALFAATLVASAVVTSRAARVATTERLQAQAAQTRAERNLAEFRKFANSIVSDVHDAVAQLPGSTSARALLISKAFEHLDSLARDAARDPALQHELAMAYLNLGDVQGKPYAANTGDTAGALASYRKAVALFEQLSSGEPGNSERRLRLSLGYERVGSLLTRMVDFPGAIEHLRRSLALREQLAAADPRNREFQRLVAASAVALGDALQYSREFPSAKDLYARALQIRQAQTSAEQADPVARMELAESYQRVGASLQAPGDHLSAWADSAEAQKFYQQSLASHRASLEVARSLLETDPANARYQRRVAESTTEMARLTDKTGNTALAVRQYRDALALYQRLAAADPQNREAQFDLAVIHRELGLVVAKTGDHSGALADLHLALAIGTKITAADPDNREVRRFVASVHAFLAQTLEERGDAPGALEHYRQLTEISEALGEPGSGAPFYIARILVKVGRTREARELMGQVLAKLKADADQPRAASEALWTLAGMLLICEPADLRDPAAALHYSKRADEIDRGRNVYAAFQLAYIYYVVGDKWQALQTARRARALLGVETNDDDMRRQFEAVHARNAPLGPPRKRDAPRSSGVSAVRSSGPRSRTFRRARPGTRLGRPS